MANASPRFEAQNLTVVRGERTVLADVSVAMERKSALVLRGPNGVGKTSLLRAMAGFIPAAEGALLWRGTPITDDMAGHRARLHFVGHLDALKPNLTVREHLAFWAQVADSASLLDVDAALAAFGIAHLADVPARFLSAGQRRRVTLSRLTAIDRPLWLLDEPLTALDDEGAACLYRTIEAHQNDGGMVVISTHAPLKITTTQTLTLAVGADDAAPEAAA